MKRSSIVLGFILIGAPALLTLSVHAQQKVLPPGFIREVPHTGKADWHKKPSPKDAAEVQQAFVHFVEVLNRGQYPKILKLYGWRDYERLVAYNPDVGAMDYLGLIKRACSQNGFQCNARVKQVVSVQEPFPGEYFLKVIYERPDGAALEICSSEGCLKGPFGQWVFRRPDGTLAVMSLAPWQT